MRSEIGFRLRSTREELGIGQTEFARTAGVKPNTYNQYENGERLPDIICAIYICDAYNVTLDWIYRGDPSGLDPKFWSQLRKRIIKTCASHLHSWA